MKLNLSRIHSDLDAFNVSLEDRGSFTSVAAARAIAYQLPIPAAPVANPALHYTTELLSTANDELGRVNESVVIDFGQAAAAVKGLWLTRYAVAHDPQNPAVRECLDQAVRASGAGRISPVAAKVVAQYPSMALESFARHLQATAE